MRSYIPPSVQAELDAAIAAGASEETQALVFAGLRGPFVVPRPLSASVRREIVTRYRRWQLEEATAPDVLARDLALLYGPEKE